MLQWLTVKLQVETVLKHCW